MSTRDELAENLTAYVDGELSELERKRIEEALKADPELAALERQLRQTASAVARMESPSPSHALRRAVLNRIDEPGAFERLKRFLTLPRLVPALGLATAAVVTAVVVTGREKPPPVDVEALYVAQNMDMVEDLDVLGLEESDDLEIVASLHELEATP